MKSINVDLEKTNMIQVFASEEFYDSWKIFFRELLQNAIDACNTRAELEMSWGTEFLEMEQAEDMRLIREHYNPHITISYNSENMMFSIEDNGIGINEYDLEHFVSKIGKSYYTSEDYKLQRLKYQPISRHGLGLFSCFMAARAILIESRKDHCINTAWNVANPQSLVPILAKWYGEGTEIEYVASKKTESGTKVTLPMKAVYGEMIDMRFLVWAVGHYTMYQPIPITLVCDGQTLEFNQKDMPWRFPHTEVLGTTVIEVDTEELEGYVALYNSRQKDFFGDSELFQQTIRVTEQEESLGLKPQWLDNFTYQLNIKERMLNLNSSRTMAVKDEKLSELRQRIGQIIIDYFGRSPANLSMYLSDGRNNMISPYEAERQLISRAVYVTIYLKNKMVDVPIRTVINGFMGRKVRIAAISRNLFEYFSQGFPHDYGDFISKYDMLVFEQNIRIFNQYTASYLVHQEYVIRETPGVIYREMELDLTKEKQLPFYTDVSRLKPRGCSQNPVFCFVSNELTEPIEILFNPFNKNASLLINAKKHKKIRTMMAIISENIKRRILGRKGSWDKIIDFGGEFIDDYSQEEALTIKSVWCLEDSFADELNEITAKLLSPQEILDYGLESLFFTAEDFISWWFPPK